jgi:hypothetical protein
MAQTKQITFSYREVAEALLKKQGIHEGVWGIYIRFGIKGANIGELGEDLTPAAIVPILEIGIQRFETENNLTVDATQVNANSSPPPPKRRRPTKR